MMLLEQYTQAQYQNQQDFEQNFAISTPDNFNFTFDCLDVLAKQKPNALAMQWCNDQGAEARYSFADMARHTDAAARYFASLGIGKGDTVLLILKRRAQFWFALLALCKLGAIAVPATHQLSAKDILYRLNSAAICAVVTTEDDEIITAVEEARVGSASLQHCITLGHTIPKGWLSLDEGILRHQQRDPFPRVTENSDDMLIYFTSGTTGPPKMVLHNHLYPLGHIVTARFWQNLHEGSLHFTVADSGWAKATWGKLFGQWLCGAAIMVYDHDYFDVKHLLDVVARYRVTSFCAPPTIYRYLVRTNLEAYDLSALEWATTAGEPLNADISRRFEQKTGLAIHEGFGQTETTPVLFTSCYMQPQFGCLGRPNPTFEVLLLDEEGQAVADDEEGEICIRANAGKTPGLFVGYYQNPAETAAVWRDGIYHTGDLAVRQPDGYYRFVGRGDDVIKASSYRIGPFEVESVLIEHPAVVECAVTGVPDPKRGQAVKASVILAENYVPNDALAAELQQYVKDNTAAYKAPRIVEFVTELPKTFSGKIRRAEIRQNAR